MGLGFASFARSAAGTVASMHWDLMGAVAGLDSKSIGVASNRPVESPVVLIMFNRPNLTRKVFDVIAAARPRKLFIVSDGPRADIKGDAQLVNECRAIIKSVNWECEVFTKYSEGNLGCRESVASGLSWVFSKVERAIILEDDCLPSTGFFQFCDELLELYKSDKSIGSICGSNLDSEETRNLTASYYPSRYPAVWGWATWRRVWNQYNSEMNEQEILSSRASILKLGLPPQSQRFWLSRLNLIAQRKLDTWDYQLVFLHWRNGMKSLVSKLNLVSNIGFGEGATHTINSNSEFANKKNLEPVFPLLHPDKNEMSKALESQFGQNRFRYSWVKLLMENFYNKLPMGLKQSIRRLIASEWFSGREIRTHRVPN